MTFVTYLKEPKKAYTSEFVDTFSVRQVSDLSFLLMKQYTYSWINKTCLTSWLFDIDFSRRTSTVIVHMFFNISFIRKFSQRMNNKIRDVFVILICFQHRYFDNVHQISSSREWEIAIAKMCDKIYVWCITNIELSFHCKIDNKRMTYKKGEH